MSGEIVLPSQKFHKTLTAANTVAVLVHYGDDLICSLELLAKCHDVLKILLLNSNTASDCPFLTSKLKSFDFVVNYDGPATRNVKYGNYDNLDDSEKTDRLIPCVYDAVSKLVTEVLSQLRDRNSLFLMTLSEELLLQVAILRQKFGLNLGMPLETTERFVSKPLMKVGFARDHVACADSIIVDTKILRNKKTSDLRLFCLEKLPQMPVFVKPTMGSGSFECQKISSFVEFATWVQGSCHLTNESFLVEELLYPPYRAIELLNTSTGFKVLAVFETLGNATYGSVLETGEGAILRSVHPAEPAYKETSDLAIQAVCSAGAKDHVCTYSVEFMHKSSGSLAVVEMAARTPAGCCEGLAVEMLSGVDVESFGILAPFAPEPLVRKEGLVEYAYIVNICAKRTGFIVEYNEVRAELIEPGTFVTGIDRNFAPGDYIEKIPSTIYGVALMLIVAGNDRSAVESTVHNIRKFYDPVEVRDSM